MLLHVVNSCKNYEKFVKLSFVEGQPIIELIFNIILSLPAPYIASNPLMVDYFVRLAEICLV